MNIETFRKINKLLNILAKRQQTRGSIQFVNSEEYKKSYIEEESSFRRLIGITEERALSNEEQIILYAEYAFLIKYANEDDTFDKEKELNRWLRLVSNLVKPTLNLQLDIFFGMIRAVNKLVNEGTALNCDLYMSKLLRRNYRQSIMSVFTEFQVVEESVKSILMHLDPAWKEVIADSENTFLDGQTGALFAFSGLTEEYENQIAAFEDSNKDAVMLDDSVNILGAIDASSDYYKIFNNYLSKFKLIFNKNGVKPELEEMALFRRALLCYGGADSYMLPPGKARKSFLDNTDRDFGFKRFLRDENSGKRNYLKELMDDITVDKPILEQLQEIIDRKTFSTEDRWKQYFITMPEILNSLKANGEGTRDPQGEWVFTNGQRFIRKNSSDDILLLSRTQTNSVNRELYSYVLFLEARKQGLAVNYRADYTDNAEKYAYYEDKQNEEIHVVYKNKENVGYVYLAKKLNDAEVIYYDSLEGMLDYVDKTIKK